MRHPSRALYLPICPLHPDCALGNRTSPQFHFEKLKLVVTISPIMHDAGRLMLVLSAAEVIAVQVLRVFEKVCTCSRRCSSHWYRQVGSWSWKQIQVDRNRTESTTKNFCQNGRWSRYATVLQNSGVKPRNELAQLFNVKRHDMIHKTGCLRTTTNGRVPRSFRRWMGLPD